MLIVRGPGLAGDVVAVEHPRSVTRAVLDDIDHHVIEQIGHLRPDDLRRQVLGQDHGLAIMRTLVQQRVRGGRRRVRLPPAFGTRDSRVRLHQRLAVRILDAIDIVRGDLESPVGEGGIAVDHLQGTQGRGPQRHGQIVGQLGLVETETLHIVPGVVAADGAHQAHGHEVA